MRSLLLPKQEKGRLKIIKYLFYIDFKIFQTSQPAANSPSDFSFTNVKTDPNVPYLSAFLSISRFSDGLSDKSRPVSHPAAFLRFRFLPKRGNIPTK